MTHFSFSLKLNLGESVLKIKANPPNVSVSSLQAKDVLASLQHHISTLQVCNLI